MTENGIPVKSLSPEQRRALDALLTGATTAQAAERAGCAERTLYRWKQEPLFSTAWQDAQDAALDETAGALVAGSRDSVLLLHSVVLNQSAQMSHRLRAADTLLNGALKWHEQRTFAQRLSAVEAALDAQP